MWVSESTAWGKQNNWYLRKSSCSEVALQSGTIRCAIHNKAMIWLKACYDATIMCSPQVLCWQLTEDIANTARLFKDKNPPFAIIMFDAQCTPGIILWWDGVIYVYVKPLSLNLPLLLPLQLVSCVSAMPFDNVCEGALTLRVIKEQGNQPAWIRYSVYLLHFYWGYFRWRKRYISLLLILSE